jgi:glycosyltransferase involved in cell wall biosynthesis/predicted O-methyltransferase YrrM
MKQGQISVIIPAYNSDKTIIQAIESVFNQTFKALEVIVVDDGSTDNIKNLLLPYIEKGVIKYFFKENGGPSSARNLGIQKVEGEFVAFLDADDYWHPEKLSKQIDILNKNPKSIVCYTEVSLVDEEGRINEVTRNKITSQKSGYVLPYFILHNIVTLSSAMVRVDVLKSIESFDEDRNIIFVEDYNLWLKLAPMGEFIAINEPLTLYRNTKINISKPNYKKVIKIFYKNMINSKIKFKIWYFLGFILNILKLLIYKIMYPIRLVKKIGFLPVIKEIKRRVLLRIDFIFYPYLLRKLKNTEFRTIQQIIDFSYNKSCGLLVPGQVVSEISQFLEMAKNIQPKNILEVGTAHGGNLFLLTKIASDGGKIISIDLPGGDFGGGYFARKKKLYNNFVTGSQKMFLIRGDSHNQNSLNEVIKNLDGEKIDLLFIDADHTYEGVKQDFEMYGPLVRGSGIIAMHDIGKTPSVEYGTERFWNEVKTGFEYKELIDNKDRLGYGIGVLFIKNSF